MLLIVPFLFLITSNSLVLPTDCPQDCVCDELECTVTCSGRRFLTIPSQLPEGYDVLIVRNASLRSVAKNAFRKIDHLREFRVESCENLDTLEKFAFKGLRKLRLISFSNCPRLSVISKGVFSGISNQFGLRIHFVSTPIQRVHGGAFRHASNIRELLISGSDLVLARHSLGSITQLDFLTLAGVSLIEPQIFSNSTRFHIVHIKESSFEIPPKGFDNLAHVHQFLIQRSKIASIGPDAFAGLSTVETLELFDNRIGNIAPRAFAGVVNLGRLRIARNNIKALDTVESLLSEAVQTQIDENTIECSCNIKWMQSLRDKNLIDSNYCGLSGVYRSIRAYLRHQCENSHSMRSVTTPETYVVSNHERITDSVELTRVSSLFIATLVLNWVI